MFKYFEHKKLIKFRNILKNPKTPWPYGYLEFHKDRIEWLDWLIASYEGRAADPKILLEGLFSVNLHNYDNYVQEIKKFNITPVSEADQLRTHIEQIKFIYNWVYYKRIIGF